MFGFAFPYLPVQLQVWAMLCRSLTAGIALASGCVPPGPSSPATLPCAASNVVRFPAARAPARPGPTAPETASAPVVDLSLARRRTCRPLPAR